MKRDSKSLEPLQGFGGSRKLHRVVVDAPDLDYVLRKEIQGNGPSSLQTSISSYFQPIPSLDT
jgi:hypothetical protein